MYSMVFCVKFYLFHLMLIIALFLCYVCYSGVFLMTLCTTYIQVMFYGQSTYD